MYDQIVPQNISCSIQHSTFHTSPRLVPFTSFELDITSVSKLYFSGILFYFRESNTLSWLKRFRAETYCFTTSCNGWKMYRCLFAYVSRKPIHEFDFLCAILWTVLFRIDSKLVLLLLACVSVNLLIWTAFEFLNSSVYISRIWFNGILRILHLPDFPGNNEVS